MTLDRGDLEQSPLADLHAIASELGIEGFRKLRRADLIDSILGGGPSDGADSKANGATASKDEAPKRTRSRGGRGRSRRGGGGRGSGEDDESAAEAPRGRKPREEPEPEEDEDDGPQEVRTGVLDVLPNGSGFMRPDPFVHSRDDVYISPAQIRRCELRSGDAIEGPVRPPRRSERHPSLVRVDKVEGADAEPPPERPHFDSLTPRFPTKRMKAPAGLDAVPFGRGSRVAIGGPPGSGSTTLLRDIALTLAGTREKLELVVVLVGVRPEEVPEWRGEKKLTVAGGSFDHPVDEQAQAAELAIERGKRAAEAGRDAVVVIDSLDALAPAVTRRLFGAARATEEAGSLTVIAGTGSAGEPLRLATTRIVLEAPAPNAKKPELAPSSGTLRAERLK